MDEEWLREYIADGGVILCGNVEERSEICRLACLCGFALGFDESDYMDTHGSKMLCVSLGRADRARIHISVEPMYTEHVMLYDEVMSRLKTEEEEYEPGNLSELYGWVQA